MNEPALNSPDGASWPVVVVADDQAIVRAPLVKLLRYGQFDARGACDGGEALALLASTRVDALVLDLMMLRVPGGKVLERVRADARWSSLPVIVVTGSLDSATLATAHALADRVMVKASFSCEELTAALWALLGRDGASRPPPAAPD